MTTTIESAFGSFHMVGGFLLNNQLTDFSAQPSDLNGTPIANRIEPGKRPRSSMSPTLVFDRYPSGNSNPLQLVTGSPGGSSIIQYVVKTLVGLIDWNMNPQEGVSMINFGAANTSITNYGGEHPHVDAENGGINDPVVQQLEKWGHAVSVTPQSSGLSALQRTDTGWIGGVDPRREGQVAGDIP